MAPSPPRDREYRAYAIPDPRSARAPRRPRVPKDGDATASVRQIRDVIDELLDVVDAEQKNVLSNMGKLTAPAKNVRGMSDRMAVCDPDQFRRDLEESIQDEIADAGFYAAIANEAPSDILRLISTSITGEEFGHARLQAALLGINPAELSPPPPIEPSGDFETDVRAAIAGELSAVTRYAQLAGCAPTPQVRYLLTSLLTDEYAHTRIWTAMLNTL